MTVYIDQPIWPAHGTFFSHLVTDRHLEELHEFARALRLPRRSFDLDHYDVPARLLTKALSLGAVEANSRQIVNVLRESGLRVKASERPRAAKRQRLEYLVTEWRRIGERGFLPRSAIEKWAEEGANLVSRWREPHRKYHNTKHLEDVLLSLDHLQTVGETIATETLLAAWYHDAIYEGRQSDEEKSAQLAHATLQKLGINREISDTVAELILATKPATDSSHGFEFAHLLDADLAIFAASNHRYLEYAQAVRQEYSHVTEEDFRTGRSKILTSYLERPQIYYGTSAQSLWEARARKNLELEINQLQISEQSL